MHPEDQAVYEKFKETAARQRAEKPLTPEEERENEAVHFDPRRDHPAFSPTTGENLKALFKEYRKGGRASLSKKYNELFPETSPSAPASEQSTNR